MTRAAAEDIAQEAFLSALSALDRFDRRRPFARLAAPHRGQPGDRLAAGPGGRCEVAASPALLDAVGSVPPPEAVGSLGEVEPALAALPARAAGRGRAPLSPRIHAG